MAPRRLVERLARLVHLRLAVVHGAEDGAGDAVADDGGGSVAVGGRGAVGGEFDSDADDGVGGVFGELVGICWGDDAGGAAGRKLVGVG